MTGIADREQLIMFELIWHVIADTDTDKTSILELNFCSRSRDSCSSELRVGSIEIEIVSNRGLYFIGVTDTKRSYFRIISAMNLVKMSPA